MATTQQIGLTATLDISQFQSSAAAYMRTLQQMQTAAASSQTAIGTAFRGSGNLAGSSVSQINSIGDAFLGVGRMSAEAAAVIMASFGGAITYVTASSINLASGFEQGLADIAAIMGRTTAEIEPLSALIQELAVDPRLKVSFDEASEAAMTLAKSGIHMEEQMGGALRSVIEGVNATGASYDFMARAVGSTLDVFRMESSQASHVVDGMVGVLNNSRMSVTDYTYAVNNAGAVMRQFGVSSDQFNAILVATRGEFSSGRTQGTGYSNMLRALTAPTDKAAGVMADLGISVADENGKFKELFQVIEEIQGAMSRLSQAEANEAMQTIFQTEGRKAFSALLGLNKQELDELTVSTNRSGQAAAAAETRMGTFESKLGILSDIISATKLALGNMFLPMLTPMLDTLNAKVGQLSGAFKTLGFTGLAAALGFDSETVNAISAVSNSIAQFSATLVSGGLEPALAGIGLNIDYVATALYGLTGAAGALLLLGAGAASVFLLSTAFAALTSPIGMAIVAVAAFGAEWNTNFLGIQDVTMWVYNRVTTTLSQLVSITSAYVSRWGDVFTKGVAAWTGIFERGFTAIYNGVAAIFAAMPTPVQAAMTNIYDIVVGTMNSAIEYVNSALSSISSAAGGYVPTISLPTIGELTFPDMPSMGDALSGLFDTTTNPLANLGDFSSDLVGGFNAVSVAAKETGTDFADYNSGLLNVEKGSKATGKSVQQMADDIAKAKEKISDNNLSMANLRGEIAQLESQFPGLTQEIVDNFNAHIAAGNSVASFGDKLGATERRQMFNYLTKLIDMNDANKALIGSNGLIDKSFGTVQDGFMQLVDTMSKGINIPTTITVAGQEFDYSKFDVVGSLAPEDAAATGMQDTNTAIDALTPNAATLGETLNTTVNPALATMGQTADTVANTNLANLNSVIGSNLLPSLGQIFTALSTQVAPALINAGTQSDLLGQAFTRLIEMSDLVTAASKRVFAAMTIESQLVQDLTKYYYELALAKQETVNAGGSTGAPATPTGGDQYAGPGFAGGGSFIVPSGYPSSGFGMPMRVHSGELVKVFTASQTRQLGRAHPSQHITSSSDNSSKVVNFNITTQQPSRSISNDLAFIKAKYGVML